MIQNKNFQEFVPSCSRPISRTPSETTQSELDGFWKNLKSEINQIYLESQQYRTGLYMRDPRHQPQRRHLMGYPHAYAAAGMRAYSIQKVGNNMKYIKNIIILIYFIYFNRCIFSKSYPFHLVLSTKYSLTAYLSNK